MAMDTSDPAPIVAVAEAAAPAPTREQGLATALRGIAQAFTNAAEHASYLAQEAEQGPAPE